MGDDQAVLVEKGIARFVHPQTHKVDLSEPLVLLGCWRWFETHKNRGSRRTIHQYIVEALENKETNFDGFENYVAFMLDLAFSKSVPLYRIFNFPDNPPPWASEPAELVMVDRRGGIEQVSMVQFFQGQTPSATLGATAQQESQVTAWLNGTNPAPMLFPPTSMGPDILFVLRLCDETLIWVAVQSKLIGDEQLKTEVLKSAVKSITPEFFYIQHNGDYFVHATQPNLVQQTRVGLTRLPNPCQTSGSYTVLRVLASFPADVGIERLKGGECPHPLVTLNFEYLKSLTQDMPPKNYLTCAAQHIISMRKENLGSEQDEVPRKNKRGKTKADESGDSPPAKRTRVATKSGKR